MPCDAVQTPAFMSTCLLLLRALLWAELQSDNLTAVLLSLHLHVCGLCVAGR